MKQKPLKDESILPLSLIFLFAFLGIYVFLKLTDSLDDMLPLGLILLNIGVFPQFLAIYLTKKQRLKKPSVTQILAFGGALFLFNIFAYLAASSFNLFADHMPRTTSVLLLQAFIPVIFGMLSFNFWIQRELKLT